MNLPTDPDPKSHLSPISRSRAEALLRLLETTHAPEVREYIISLLVTAWERVEVAP